ncbi:MAG: ABC transporter substrate-binding protein [Bacteroidales bacterium]|nr:ABC transporter substrate-binding protein [Bacteroidales bacterium]
MEKSLVSFVSDSLHPVKYAQYFRLGFYKQYRSVQIVNPWDTSQVKASFVILPENEKEPEISSEFTIIKLPIRKIATTSGTLVSFLEKIGMLSSLKGISDASFILNPFISSEYKKGNIENIGSMESINHEKLLFLNPDITFISLFRDFDPGKLSEITQVAYLADYIEKTPLGRAEWLRFIAVFYGKEKEADSIFSEIESSYLKLKASVNQLQNRPTVFDGMFFQGSWYLSGGDSYMARYYKDAGVDYIWGTDSSTASFPLGFEEIYLSASKADFWRITVNSDQTYSMERFLAEDERYALFKAFTHKNIVYCDTKNLPYFERGIIEPHIILADLVKAFHPELLKDYKPVYYHILK